MENDVEHSYSLAMAAWFLAPHFPELNRDKLIRIALAHDLVEIHAGDTFAYADKSIIAGKKKREKLAYEQLTREWPDFPELLHEIHEYEALESAESRFVSALDKLMPAILAYLNNGYVWQKHDVSFHMFQTEKEKKTKVSPEIHEYYNMLVDLLQKNQHMFPATPGKQI